MKSLNKNIKDSTRIAKEDSILLRWKMPLCLIAALLSLILASNSLVLSLQCLHSGSQFWSGMERVLFAKSQKVSVLG